MFEPKATLFVPRLVTRPQQSASDSTILVARSALLVWVLTPWWMLVLNEMALIPRFSWQESTRLSGVVPHGGLCGLSSSMSPL